MYKTFGSETLLSEDLNGIMRQTIIRVANAAELDALAPVEAGMIAYREDNATYYERGLAAWHGVSRNVPEQSIPFTGPLGTSSTGYVAMHNGIIHVYGIALQVGTVANGGNVGTLDPTDFPVPHTWDIPLVANAASASSTWLRISADGAMRLFHVGATANTYLRGASSIPAAL